MMDEEGRFNSLFIRVRSSLIRRGMEKRMGGWETVSKYICARLTVASVMVLSVGFTVGCERETVLVIEKPTEVHGIVQESSQDPSTNVQLGKVIATLQAGETARAVGVYHGENHDGFKVKLADGTEGLILASDTFKVTSR